MPYRKHHILFGFFSYGGNGGISSEHPNVRDWYIDSLLACKTGNMVDRVSVIDQFDVADTPITMGRNAMVMRAREMEADILVMCDSDMRPDMELKRDIRARPFFQSSFEFLDERWDKGPHVVVAPYCGPPPHENVYVFRWASYQSDHPDEVDHRVESFSREDAARRSGFEEIAAGPTGLSMYDMRAFDLIEPPYFYYEFEGDGPPCKECGCRKPGYQARKASTEDVTNLRDIALHGMLKLNYNPVYVNWDAWAGHWKPKCVGKPQLITTDHIASKYTAAVKRGNDSRDRMVVMGNGRLPEAYFEPATSK